MVESNLRQVEKDLIINSTPKGVEMALLENKQLVELHRESDDGGFRVGDIYLGKVRKINPGLNATFVDVGYERDAFLHYTDLNPYFKSIAKYIQLAMSKKPVSMQAFRKEPEIVKTGKINNVVSKNLPILVQVIKEPIQTKGPRLSCEISLPGRFLVLTPFNEVVGVSRKIASGDERKRLQNIIESIRPKNFGVIVRTVAEGKSVQVLHEDLLSQVKKWEEITEKLSDANPPQILFSESSKTNTLLRDILSDSFNSVVSNDSGIVSNIHDYIKKIAPGSEKIVVQHNNNRPLFDAYGVTRQIKSLFGRTVNMSTGAYLIIEHTEALHVIDVNSGNKTSVKGDQESNAVSVNLESAREIARQLRLRDIGGIITIDFIDMRKPENKKLVYQEIKEAMKNDRAKHSILPISKFGVMQITRQRVRPEVNIVTSEVCPSCNGTGKIEASILILPEVERKLEFLIKQQNQKKLKLVAHPFLEAYIKRGKIFNSLQWKWYRKYHQWIAIQGNDNYHYMEYHLFDGNDEEIKVD
jgi:ribonuclease G